MVGVTRTLGRLRIVAPALLGLAVPGAGEAQSWLPTRVEAPPALDGVLDDVTWAGASSVDGFRTYEPDYGSAMLGDTRVLMAYDESNLYFAFDVGDPDPSQIRASVTSRDNIYQGRLGRDQSGLLRGRPVSCTRSISTRTGSRATAGSRTGTEDRGVDVVWYSRRLVSTSADTPSEVQHSRCKSIRFKRGRFRSSMGVIFERRISRSSEFGTVPELDPARAGQWENQMHPITYRGIRNPRVLEVLPAVTYALDQRSDQGTLTTSDEQRDLSLTAKLGLTSDLVLDATYNPDFSQVEADAGQVDVNLRSAIFYPEKRPFFLEGREHFGFAATGGLSPVRSVVYTRRIVDPRAGGRLTGKVGTANTLASIYAADELLPGPEGTEYAHVPVLRYKRSLSGDSYLGALYGGRLAPDRTNHVGGGDLQVRLGSSGQLELHGLASRTDAKGLPGTVAGHSVAARLSSSRRRLDLSLDVLDVSEGFTPDVGFLSREGVFRGAGRMVLRLFPSIPHFRRIDVDLVQAHTRDHPSRRWENHTRLHLANHVFGSVAVRGWVQNATEVFQGQRFDDDGYGLQVGGLIANTGAFGVSYERRTQAIYEAVPYQGRSRAFSAVLGLQPSARLDTEISFNSVDYYRASTSEQVLDFKLLRARATIQPNRYLFFRVIAEYDWYREDLLTDLLASFTYIPGTVVHLGYGSLYQRRAWDGLQYAPATGLHQMRRRFFFKTSYLFRR